MLKEITSYEWSVVILERAKAIIHLPYPWDVKYRMIFSADIKGDFDITNFSFRYHDPNSDYEDDVMAWYNAAKQYIGQ